ncbi:hypothetical protein BDB00DRAFT_830147 [Zychaea mexicana]|uniref:uncharacterized protein n=1 Tax=Zychaea mexicana TaxID=64656 RepID=UPI0022FDEF51|nr:uncharacterized protein BDB00DRAFT_830147 [Zychaea mexicana]KAI9492085.1 hypothetical protein BDB00DRAFT_830147 [Zychaea mexicana]
MDDPNDFDNDDSSVAATSTKPVKHSGRKKIKIEYIQDKNRRHITFSKRKAGIMKKAYELSTLTGTQVLLLIVSETGLVYTFTTPKLQPMVTKPEGKNLIQTCLNAPDPIPNDVASSSSVRGDADEESSIASPRPTTVMPKAAMNASPNTVPLAHPPPPPQQQQQQQQPIQDSNIAYASSSPYMMGGGSNSRYDTGYPSGGPAPASSYANSTPLYQPHQPYSNMSGGGNSGYPTSLQHSGMAPAGAYWVSPSSVATSSAQYPDMKPPVDPLGRVKRE